MILDGALQPGERLRIDELARQLGVSPMPVREALHQLAAEGTITLDPYRGFSISELSATEAEDLYSTRAALEALAAEIAVPRLGDDDLNALRDAVRAAEVTRRHTEQAAERVIASLLVREAGQSREPAPVH